MLVFRRSLRSADCEILELETGNGEFVQTGVFIKLSCLEIMRYNFRLDTVK